MNIQYRSAHVQSILNVYWGLVKTAWWGQVLHDGVKFKEWVIDNILDHDNIDEVKTNDNTENTFTETNTLMTVKRTKTTGSEGFMVQWTGMGI